MQDARAVFRVGNGLRTQAYPAGTSICQACGGSFVALNKARGGPFVEHGMQPRPSYLNGNVGGGDGVLGNAAQDDP